MMRLKGKPHPQFVLSLSRLTEALTLSLLIAKSFTGNGIVIIRHFFNKYSDCLDWSSSCFDNSIRNLFNKCSFLLIGSACNHFNRNIWHSFFPHYMYIVVKVILV